MNSAEKLQFIRDNVIVDYDKNNSYHLDMCDKCHKVILHSSDYQHWDHKDGDFLYKCLVCNLKVCHICSLDTCCMDPTYCKDCRSSNDLIECPNCKRKCFDYCTTEYGEKIEVYGVLCCRHCEIVLFSELHPEKDD